MKEKTYLGDAVYARFDEFGNLILTTENGIEVTNTIVLEWDVFNNLLRFQHQYLEQLAAVKVTP